MSADSESLDTLAASVSDGDPVDWAGPDAAAADVGESEMAALREVARIADFNRRLQRGPGEEGAAGAVSSTEPRRWGDLLLLESLGSGTSGEVWRAWDLRLEREVALKFLQSRAEDEAASGAEAALLAEARSVARVRHPSVVTVHGIDAHEGRVGMWMELLRGETLAAAIERRGALPAGEVARIGREVAQALEAVHAAGLVHRDVKPANIMLEASGRVVLTDFGLGRRADAVPQVWRISGTPLFMAPELLAGGTATPRSDLYALGVSLRWALTGRCPFASRSFEDLRAEAAAGPRVALAEECREAPAPLVRAIERAMATDPEARFAGASAMARAFEPAHAPAAAAPRPGTGHGARWAIAAAAVVAAALVWYAALRNQQSDSPAAPPPAAPLAEAGAYDIEATLVRRDGGASVPLAEGDRVAPGDRLSLQLSASRNVWVYVLNEDERGECFLLYPQPLFDLQNPIPAGRSVSLPGTVAGRENTWRVSSRGQSEHFLVVASPDPLPALEAELERLPAASPGRPIQYAAVPAPVLEQLRGVGTVAPMPEDAARGSQNVLERFAALAGRETDVRGVWMRRLTLENPLR